MNRNPNEEDIHDLQIDQLGLKIENDLINFLQK